MGSMFACSPYNQGKCFVHNWISHLQVFFLKEFETSSVFKDWTSLDLSFTNGTWIWHFRWLSMTQVACGTHLVLAQILNSAVFFSGGISISASACWWMMMENCRPSKMPQCALMSRLHLLMNGPLSRPAAPILSRAWLQRHQAWV